MDPRLFSNCPNSRPLVTFARENGASGFDNAVSGRLGAKGSLMVSSRHELRLAAFEGLDNIADERMQTLVCIFLLAGDTIMNADRNKNHGPTVLEIAAALAFALGLMIAAYVKIGLPPVIIVGGSSLVGMLLWLRTYRHGPIDPRIILPPFLITVAALEVHMIEEYSTGFGPAMSRLFNISWTEYSFLIIFTFAGPVLYSITALGLYMRIRIAGFVACFIFIGPGVAELSHFIFPILTPAIEPHNPHAVTVAVANGTVIANMKNYWLFVTGRYYFPGLYTAILPMIPGIYAIRSILRASSYEKSATPHRPLP